MFGLRKHNGFATETETKLKALEAQLVTQERTVVDALTVLRTQVAGLSHGIPFPVESIMNGLAFAAIAAEEIAHFIPRVPNLLVLDIRNDASWDRAHIAEAKHVVAEQLPSRLHELSDPLRPILVVCADGNQSVPACKLLVRAGYRYLFFLDGGMAAYRGPVVESKVYETDITRVRGTDRVLIERVAQLIDNDVRPGLIRDGGDLELVAVEEGIVKVRMVGACHGCGAQGATVQNGIRLYLMHAAPEVKGVEDLT